MSVLRFDRFSKSLALILFCLTDCASCAFKSSDICSVRASRLWLEPESVEPRAVASNLRLAVGFVPDIPGLFAGAWD